MSNESYPPYSGDRATCPKCGGDMDKSYQRAGTRHVGGRVIAPAPSHPEWMLRECFDCDYTWPEMCADAT